MADRTEQTRDLQCLAVAIGDVTVGAPLRVLMVKLGEERSAPAMLEARESVDLADLRGVLDHHHCGRLLVILPAAATLAPGFPIATDEHRAAAAAAALQVETVVAQGEPAYRVAGAASVAIRTRAGLLGLTTTWMSESAVEAWAHSILKAVAPASRRKRAQRELAIDVTFVAPTALAFAAVDDSVRQAEAPAAALWVDRASAMEGEDSRTVAVVLGGVGSGAARTTRVDLSLDGGTASALGACVLETATMAQWPEQTALAASSAARRIHAPDNGGLYTIGFALPSIMPLEGAPAESEWWASYGPLVVAASMASVGSNEGAHALTTLRVAPPAVAGGKVAQLVATWQEPRNVWRATIAALLVLALAPMGFAGARLLLDQLACEDVDQLRAQVEQQERRLGMYNDADAHAWSMTKVMADLAATAPEAIEFRTIKLTNEGREGLVAITGEAKTSGSASGADAILEMERLMRASKVFGRISKEWEAVDTRGLTKFSIHAFVTRPAYIPEYPIEQDFAARTMRERRYGPTPTQVASNAGATRAAGTDDSNDEAAGEPVRPSELTPPDAPEEGSEATARGGRGSAGSSSGRGSAGSGPAEGVARRGAAVTRTGGAEETVPPELTQAQVDAMTLPEVQDALPRYATARNIQGIDDDTKARLKRDWDMLLARTKALRDAGGTQ